MTAPAIVRRQRPGPQRTAARTGALPAVAGLARDQLVVARRGAPLVAVLLTAVVAHAGLAGHLAVWSVEPDVLLLAVVAVAAGRGARAGAAFGFAAGLGADLFLATPLGTSALAYTLVGHVVGRSGRQSMAVGLLAVATGRVGAAMVATALGGLPFPASAGLLRIVGAAILSAPLGIPAAAAGRRLGLARGGRR